jgi:hypothetical protein
LHKTNVAIWFNLLTSTGYVMHQHV